MQRLFRTTPLPARPKPWPYPEAPPPMPMIQAVNLTKRYGELSALNNLNLSIEQGECFGFLGPNGAGKTTTIKIFATLLRPTWGEARIDGLSVGPVNARQVRAVIGYVPDYFGSYQDLTVREYLEFFAAAYDIDPAKRKGVIDDVLQLTDLSYKADSETGSLSRGMQQRLSVARVLVHDPKVLLMDEPASGLDPRARIEMRELLKELHRMGKTILISSHILLELADLCTTFGILERGELQFVGTRDEIYAKAKGARVYRIGVASKLAPAAEVVRQTPGVTDVSLEPDHLRLELDPAAGDPARVAAALVKQGYDLTRLEEEQVNLETAFMRLTQGLVQ
ncbi:MAG: ABC transporter ATP-binding protein [Planctomycetota bacterium]